MKAGFDLLKKKPHNSSVYGAKDFLNVPKPVTASYNYQNLLSPTCLFSHFLLGFIPNVQGCRGLSMAITEKTHGKFHVQRFIC